MCSFVPQNLQNNMLPTVSWILLANSQKLSFYNQFWFFFIRQTTWQDKLCPACLISKIEQTSRAELVLPGGLSDHKSEVGFAISALHWKPPTLNIWTIVSKRKSCVCYVFAKSPLKSISIYVIRSKYSMPTSVPDTYSVSNISIFKSRLL